MAIISYQYSFDPNTIKKWNNLPNQLIDLASHNQFLSGLYNYLAIYLKQM